MARPVTLVFRIAEEGVLQVGSLADWQQDHHLEKWPYPVRSIGLKPGTSIWV